MFFIFGIIPKKCNLDYNQDLKIHNCDNYSSVEVYMTYTTLSIFFIPTFRWNKKYYVKFSCCNEIYELSSTIGHKIEQKDFVPIEDKDLISTIYKNTSKKCNICNNSWDDSYEFCPKCGNKL